MSTSPAEQPGSGIVTFTQQGERALDRLAADLVDHCDGSTASIADILEQVLSADVAELADKLDEEDPGRSSSQEVAALLGVSTSTMKRRLDDEGTTFREVRQSLLRERAIVRLLDHSLTISQIAVDLGYSDLANFSHAFRRWTGQSPSEFRKVGRRGPG